MISIARQIADTALEDWETNETLASERIEELVSERTIDRRDANLAREITGGVLRHRRTIDATLSAFTDRPLKTLEPSLLRAMRIGAFEILYLDRIPARASVNEAVNLARSHSDRGTEKLANAVLRKVSGAKTGVIPDRRDLLTSGSPLFDRRRYLLPSRDGSAIELNRPVLPDPTLNFAGWLSLAFSLPDVYVRELLRRYDRAAILRIADATVSLPPLTVRINERRLPSADMPLSDIFEGLDAPPDAVPLPVPDRTDGGLAIPSPNASTRLFRLPRGIPVGVLPGLRSGYYVAQDPSAAAVAQFLDLKPGQRVLDLCAAPGGKTLQIADAIRSGKITAMDSNIERVGSLRDNIRRASADDIVTVEALDATQIGARYPAAFDRILVDAPCSGSGVLSRRWEIRERLTDEYVSRFVPQQQAILSSALIALAPNGKLVYSTCSIMDAENRQVVKAVVEKMNQTAKGGKYRIEGHAEFLPLASEREGGFVAVVSKHAR